MWLIDADRDLRKTNPGIDGIFEYSKLSNRNLLYIYYVYDWNSPLYKIRLKDKKIMALKEAGFKWENYNGGSRPDKNARNIMNMENQRMNDAIRKFITIQRASDQDRALLEALQIQIEEATELMAEKSKNVAEFSKKLAIAKDLKTLVGYRKEIAKTLDIRTVEAEEAEEEINKDMSSIDKFNLKNQEQSTH